MAHHMQVDLYGCIRYLHDRTGTYVCTHTSILENIYYKMRFLNLN